MIARRSALGGLAAGLVTGLGSGLSGQHAFAANAPLVFNPANALIQGGWLRATAAPHAILTLDGQALPQAADGAFFAAFDRDAPPDALLICRAGPVVVEQHLSIAPRAWRIEHVDAPFHPPALPDEDFARLRKAELARIDAARKAAPVIAAEGWRQKFIWPGRGRISGLFGSQRTYRGGVAGAYHSGTDIALAGGTPYLAPADGVVVLAAEEPFTLEGRLLMIDHGMGLNSAFLHSSALLVKEGDRVAQGQPIGRVGMTGRATGPHLHWSMRWREARLDPMLFTGPMG